MNEHRRANRKLWDVWAERHSTQPSLLYDVDAFRAGACSLDPIEIAEVGDVTGRSLLHLQCHFGMDTLSWARRGARATGVDFSPQGIVAARRLATETAIDARFVLADVFALPAVLDETFDIVFTSAGVLCWLDDLPAWGRVVARMLAPEGMFYLREFHPFAMVFADTGDGELRLHYPYAGDGTPLVFSTTGSYAVPDCSDPIASYEWPYSLSQVLNALLEAGLVLDFLHEFCHCGYRMHPCLVEDSPGRWVHPTHPRSLPLQFSLRARHRR